MKYEVRAAGKVFNVEGEDLTIVYNDDVVEFIDEEGAVVFVVSKHVFESAALESFARIQKSVIPDNK